MSLANNHLNYPSDFRAIGTVLTIYSLTPQINEAYRRETGDKHYINRENGKITMDHIETLIDSLDRLKHNKFTIYKTDKTTIILYIISNLNYLER